MLHPGYAWGFVAMLWLGDNQYQCKFPIVTLWCCYAQTRIFSTLFLSSSLEVHFDSEKVKLIFKAKTLKFQLIYCYISCIYVGHFVIPGCTIWNIALDFCKGVCGILKQVVRDCDILKKKCITIGSCTARDQRLRPLHESFAMHYLRYITVPNKLFSLEHLTRKPSLKIWLNGPCST